ncbi:HlyD family secretion protein [Piscinibacter terrae]|nr:HlyD family efflux transporter periplasmic adaptor subunit [Albitalea terrae]
MKLFRQEAVEARSAQWLGTVRLVRPLGFSVATAVAAFLAVLLVSFVFLGEVNRKAHVPGLLVPALGSVNITAPTAGVVSQRLVSQGDRVQPGDVLMVVDTERQALGGEQAGGGVETRIGRQIESRRQSIERERAMREMQVKQRDQSMADRLRTLSSELRQSEEELAMQRRRVELGKKSADRFAQLAREGFVSEVQAQGKQEELIDITTRLQSMERVRLSLLHDQQVLVQDRQTAQAQWQNDLQQLARGEESIRQEADENASKKTFVVVAPALSTASKIRRYRVAALGPALGQAVQAGQLLVTLVPESEDGSVALEAHLYAPTRAAGFVQPGQWVYLRYAAYPYQKFGLYRGQVLSVSGSPYTLGDLPGPLAAQLGAQVGPGEALFLVRVQLDEQTVIAFGRQQALKPGLALDADVVQDRRAIWEWVAEPILAAKTQMKVLAAHPKPNHGGEGGV